MGTNIETQHRRKRRTSVPTPSSLEGFYVVDLQYLSELVTYTPEHNKQCGGSSVFTCPSLYTGLND